MATFEVLKPFPSEKELEAIRQKHFTATVGSIVADAVEVFKEMSRELETWYDSMPEGLQGSAKGDEVKEAQEALNLPEPDIPEEATDITVVYVPLEWIESRGDKRSNAVKSLQAVVDALNKLEDEKKEEVLGFITDLEDLISEADSIEFPGFR